MRNLCQILGVSSSGFYAWLKRQPSRRRLSDIMIGDRLEAFHRESDGNYGRPRLHADLREHGIAISGKRGARLMRERNIQGATRRRFTVTTLRDRTARPAPDLVDRRFQADAPDQLWVADIAYVPTWSGFLYLAVVLDVYSRRIIGWAMANHLRTELVLDALDMAIFRRNPKNVIHHSDQGTQYTSISFGSRCREAGILERNARMRATRQATIQESARGIDRDLRLHRRLVQPASSPLSPRLSLTQQLRAADESSRLMSNSQPSTRSGQLQLLKPPFPAACETDSELGMRLISTMTGIVSGPKPIEPMPLHGGPRFMFPRCGN